MPIRLNTRMIATRLSGNPWTSAPVAGSIVVASLPKYTATATPMKTQRISRNLPCVCR